MVSRQILIKSSVVVTSDAKLPNQVTILLISLHQDKGHNHQMMAPYPLNEKDR